MISIILILLFVFLFITFGYSAFEKINTFPKSVEYYSHYIKNNTIAKCMKFLLFAIIIAEIGISIGFLVGMYEVFFREPFIGFWAIFCACLLLIVFVIGQRIAHDYEGAKGTAIYFLLCLLGMILISFSQLLPYSS